MLNYNQILNVLVKSNRKQRALNIFCLSMKPITKQIFDVILNNPQGVTCKDIKDQTGIDTKNISTMLDQLISNYPIEVNKTNPKKFIYKLK